jgi:hypothetical protein
MEYKKAIELGTVTAPLEAPVIQASQTFSQKCVNDWSHINTVGGKHCTARAESWNSKTDFIYSYTRRMSKVSSDHRNFARLGHETVARAQSYLVNIPEGVRHVSIAVASSSSKLELLKYGWAHRKSHRLWHLCSHPISKGQEYPTSRYSQASVWGLWRRSDEWQYGSTMV